MQQQEVMVGGMRPQPAAKKDQAVIARLPPHVKSMLMLLALTNSIVFFLFGVGWLGFDEEMSVLKIAVSAMAAFWCVICIPIFMWFITRTDWGQRGGS